MHAASVPVIAPPATGLHLASMPDVWRASELARARVPVAGSGHAVLDAQLPGGGWPRSSLVELLLQQPGIGELQLLQPTLAKLSCSRTIALVQPPYIPHVRAARTWGIDPARLLWVRAATSADALWSTEQILKNGSCGAVVLWQTNIRADALRRLHLAAQGTEAWIWMIRPMACAQEPSPALLRLGLRPAHGGVNVSVVKRRGPSCDDDIYVRLADMPDRRHVPDTEHATITHQFAFSVAATRGTAPVLV